MNRQGNIQHENPTFEVSVGAAFFCIIKNRTANEIIYEPTVIRSEIIRTLTITPTIASGTIHASSIVYEYINDKVGVEIELGAVALPRKLLKGISGAEHSKGVTIERVTDVSKEIAFGYWAENRDGSLIFHWHPVCKLTQSSETKETRTDDAPDPEKSYTITVIPYQGKTVTSYDQRDAIEDGETPIGIDEFFARPFYNIEDMPTRDIPAAPAAPEPDYETITDYHE